METQIKLATQYAQARWPGVRIEVYSDNDLTAADPDTFRPEYHRLLGDIASGHVAEIVSADHERLIRQIAEGEALIPLLRAAGLEGTWGYRDGFTSVRPGETMVTRVKHVFGAEYVEGLKVKLHERQARNAGRGIPHGGVKYGYRRGVLPNGDKTLTIDEEQAKWVRWMVEQVLTFNRPVTRIADELNERQVPTGMRWAKGTMRREKERRRQGLPPEARQPARWTTGNVIGVLTNLTIAGRRQYRGEDVGAGNWEPIIDLDTHRMLRARLVRTRTSPRPAQRKYLLSGVVFCAECGTKLTGAVRARRGDRVWCLYRCRGCFRVNMNGDALEAHVTAKLLERLDRLIELRRGDPSAAQRRSEINRELNKLADRRELIGEMVAVGDMDRVAAVRGKATLDRLEAELTRELSRLPKDDELPDPEAVRHAWEYMTVEERRQAVGEYIERIEVTAPKTSARRTDLSRVSIHGPGWEDDEAPPPPGAVAATWRKQPADLSDQEWALVADLVAPLGRGGRRGRSLKHDARALVDAALYRETTGCWWYNLPDRYPPSGTVERYYYRWLHDGTWDVLCARLKAHATGQPIPTTTPPATAPGWRPLPSDVTDEEWAAVADLVAPPGRGRVGRRGRPFRHDLRQVLDAVLYREATGCLWRELPDRYPPHRSVDRFWHQWRRDGTWTKIRHRLQTHTSAAA